MKLKDQGSPKVPHRWRTRADGFAEVWPEAQAMLAAAPELEARVSSSISRNAIRDVLKKAICALFSAGCGNGGSCMDRPGKSTLPRRAGLGKSSRRTGRGRRSWGSPLRGPYAHLLCHSVLIHSNWEWATRCASESLLSLRSGIQAALSHLGRVPRTGDRQLFGRHPSAQP